MPGSAPSVSGRPAGPAVTHFAPPQPAALALPTSPLVPAGGIALDTALAGLALDGSAGAAGVSLGPGAEHPAAPAAASPLANTAKYFALPMALFEGLLGQRFPLPSMQQVGLGLASNGV